MKNIFKIGAGFFGILLLIVVVFFAVIFSREKRVTLLLEGAQNLNGQKLKLSLENGTSLEILEPFADGKEVILTSTGTNRGLLVDRQLSSGQWERIEECGYFGFLLNYRFKTRVTIKSLPPPETVNCADIEASF